MTTEPDAALEAAVWNIVTADEGPPKHHISAKQRAAIRTELIAQYETGRKAAFRVFGGYIQHTDQCAYGGGNACNCGLSALLAEAQSALADGTAQRVTT